MENLVVFVGMEQSLASRMAKNFIHSENAESVQHLGAEMHYFLHEKYAPLAASSKCFLVDASSRYACNKKAMSRFPLFRTKLILAFPNYFSALNRSFFYFKNINDTTANTEKNLLLKFHNSLAENQIENYFFSELKLLKNSTFFQRVLYEMTFNHLYGDYPFCSILSTIRFHQAVKVSLEYLNVGSVFVCSENKISKKNDFALFKNNITEQNADVFANKSESSQIINSNSPRQPKPKKQTNLHTEESNFIRELIEKDCEFLEKVVMKSGLKADYIDTEYMLS